MERIFKYSPPQGFIDWYKNRVPRPTIWDHLPSSDPQVIEEGIFYYSKERLRAELYKEQYAICCYCNKSIQNDHTSIIEHFLPRSVYELETFNYNNLLLSCDGNYKKETDKKYHCDKLKQDKVLKLNPSNILYLKDLIYDEFGGIYSNTNEGIEAIKVLGLDCNSLVNRRKIIIGDIVFDNFNSYSKSSKYRKIFFKIINRPIEFKYQIINIMLNKMNIIDKSMCLIIHGFHYKIRRYRNLIRIIRNYLFNN